MKLIKLTQGKFAKVDDEYFEYLSQFTWHANKAPNTYYASRGYNDNGKPKSIAMHRDIMKPAKGFVVDHIDHDGLNNQRSNLRVCTHKENLRNRNSMKGSTSKYVGVYRRKTLDKRYNREYYYYIAQVNGVSAGCFKNEDDAARAYNKAVFEKHGEFANLNIIPGDPIKESKNQQSI